MDADAVELRVLGSLVEKQRTTPDVYPLSLNSLRAACNQTTNRDPVVEYDEPTIRAALERLSRRGWVRLASGPGSRAAKYRHLIPETLRLTESELSLLAVLMLRGPQTLGELKQRTERLYPFGSLADVAQTLDALIERDYAERLPRRPGQKEERYRQLLGAEAAPVQAQPPAPTGGPPTEPDPRLDELEERVARLESELESLRESLAGGSERDEASVARRTLPQDARGERP